MREVAVSEEDRRDHAMPRVSGRGFDREYCQRVSTRARISQIYGCVILLRSDWTQRDVRSLMSIRRNGNLRGVKHRGPSPGNVFASTRYMNGQIQT
jgi:hypothetical protein